MHRMCVVVSRWHCDWLYKAWAAYEIRNGLNITSAPFGELMSVVRRRTSYAAPPRRMAPLFSSSVSIPRWESGEIAVLGSVGPVVFACSFAAVGGSAIERG